MEQAREKRMNAKQEIHEILRRCVRYARPFTEEEEGKVRAILETHELVRIYSQPFDPTLCGFEHTYQWSNGDYVITREGEEGYIEGIGRKTWPNFPWPATQSDGEILLRFLGVLV